MHERQEDLVDDSDDVVVTQRLERHEQVVPEQVERDRTHSRSDAAGIGVPTSDGAVEDLVECAPGLVVEHLGPQFGERTATDGEVGADQDAEQWNQATAGLVRSPQHLEDVPPEGSGVRRRDPVAPEFVGQSRAHEFVAVGPPSIDDGPTGPGPFGDGLDGEPGVTGRLQLRPGRLQDRLFELLPSSPSNRLKTHLCILADATIVGVKYISVSYWENLMAEKAPPAIPRQAIVTALVLITGGLAVIFDSTIVSIALRTLADDLHVPVSTIQWVSTAYLLALAVTIPVVGWAQARIGGQRLWMVGLTIFLVASIACSLAWNAQSLIVFRVIQGIGGGVMLPLMVTLAIQQVPGAAGLGRLMALVSLPAALGPILGPTIGGLILNVADWRFLFWVNVPFCVVGLALAWRKLPNDPPSGRRPLDTVGLLLVSPGLVGVLYGLSNVQQSGGFTRTDVWLPLIAGILLLAAFGLRARHRPGTALIDIRLLGRKAVASSSAVLFLSGASLYGSMLLLPLYFQIVRGTDPLAAALLLIPQGVGALLSRSIAGKLTDTVGARLVAIGGFAVMGLATIPFALAGAGTNDWWLMAVLLVRGFGMGAVLIPVMSVAYIGLGRPEVADASIITRLAQQTGGAFGTALLAVILESATHGSRAGDLAHGFHIAFWWAVGFTVLAIGVCRFLPARPATPAPGRPRENTAARAPEEVTGPRVAR